ncbi:MAG: glycosyl hydrolase 53 family protein [Kibdelosporangium sp.]
MGTCPACARARPRARRTGPAWRDHTGGALTKAAYDHTYDVLTGLKAQGTTADMVQVGNEINGGTLWPDGSTDNWDTLAALLKSGAAAVKAVSPATKVVLHLAEAVTTAAPGGGSTPRGSTSPVEPCPR